MARMTTISISEENRQKLLAIRERVLGLGASFNDAQTEVLAVYHEHQKLQTEYDKLREKLKEYETQ